VCCYSHTIQARDLRGFFRRVNWCGILDRRQVWFRLIVGRSLNWPENREVRRCRSRRFLAAPILRATCNWHELHLRHGGVLGAAPPYLDRIWIYIWRSHTHKKVLFRPGVCRFIAHAVCRPEAITKNKPKGLRFMRGVRVPEGGGGVR